MPVPSEQVTPLVTPLLQMRSALRTHRYRNVKIDRFLERKWVPVKPTETNPVRCRLDDVT